MRRAFFLFLSLALLVLDQSTKLWATASLKPVGVIEIIPGLFRLTYAVNSGVAFSLLADSPSGVRWLLAAISAGAAVVVGMQLTRTSILRTRMNTALAMLLAGIVGNLIDRVRLGEVVDFLDFHWAERWTWPTFNFADAAICCGAVLLALELLREEKLAEPKSTAAVAAAEETSLGSD
jgi:signal peptidase II